jgi:hypothetical protein
MESVIAEAATRPVNIESEAGNVASSTFGTIFDIITSHKHSVYVYGGVIRDVVMKGPHVADDIDVLFSCSVKELVKYFEARGWVLGQDFHLKKDEKTGENRYDYISVGKGKEKFSGHTLDSNCAGEFTMNCMLYDVERRLLIDSRYTIAQHLLPSHPFYSSSLPLPLLIDSSGWGLQDAALQVS